MPGGGSRLGPGDLWLGGGGSFVRRPPMCRAPREGGRARTERSRARLLAEISELHPLVRLGAWEPDACYRGFSSRYLAGFREALCTDAFVEVEGQTYLIWKDRAGGYCLWSRGAFNRGDHEPPLRADRHGRIRRRGRYTGQRLTDAQMRAAL